MHVLIPYALSDDPAAKEVLRTLLLPQLQALLTQLSLQGHEQFPVDTAVAAHERLQAAARGLDPQAPAWAALRAHELKLPGAAHEAWAFVTPSHWELGQARVTLRDPQALALSEDESRSLLTAMQAYFAEDGLTLHYEQPLRWLVRGEPLRGLVTASPERVIGRDVAPWLPASALLRRLQNEMQMLLYTHAVNDARAARGALTVNSFWLHGAGALAAPPVATEALTVLTALVPAAVHGDWAAWGRAWQTLDGAALAPLNAALAAGQPLTLTLGGEHSARRYAATPRSLWARLLHRLRPLRLSDILGTP